MTLIEKYKKSQLYSNIFMFYMEIIQLILENFIANKLKGSSFLV